MGYLDSSTITVDAVLTKKGRELLSTPGGSLNISQFTLSDTGVDYNLWNTGHPSGSTYYGEAIENLPQTEALPNSQFAVRNKLVTMAQGMKEMPALISNVENHTFTTATPLQITLTLEGFNGSAAAGNGIHLIIPDTNVLTSNTGVGQDITGNALSFIYEQDIDSSQMYEHLATGTTHTFEIVPNTNLQSSDGNGTPSRLTFIDIRTGAYTEVEITVSDNLVPIATRLEGRSSQG